HLINQRHWSRRDHVCCSREYARISSARKLQRAAVYRDYRAAGIGADIIELPTSWSRCMEVIRKSARAVEVLAEHLCLGSCARHHDAKRRRQNEADFFDGFHIRKS